MSTFKNLFPEGFNDANKIVYKNLEKGTVLRMFVQDTNPPKVKIFIVLGLHYNKVALGTLFVNSEINENINFSTELQSLQYKLYKDECLFLNHDSYVDCSNIQQRDNETILIKVNDDNTRVLGCLSPETFEEIRKMIISAETIRGRYKKNFGLYNE